MGNGHLLHPRQAGRTVSVHDPGALRQQNRRLQDRNTADSKPGVGHHSPGHEEGEKESLRGVAAPQRPGISVYLSGVLQPGPSIRHYTVHIKTRKSV